MPTTLPDLILLDARTAATAGDALGIGGAGMRYGNKLTKPNQDQFPIKFKVRVRLKDSTSGGSATVAIQTSPDNSVWTTVKSFALLVPSSSTQDMADGGFSTTKRWIRANVTAIAGGAAPAVDCYATVGSWGV